MSIKLSGAEAGRHNFFVGLELVGEIRNSYAERLWVVIGAMTGTLLRAKWAGEVVVRVRNIGAVLRVQSYLKEVRKRAAIAVRTSRAVGTNGSRMDDVVTGGMQRERRDSSIAIDAFGRIDIPLCPAIVAGALPASSHEFV